MTTKTIIVLAGLGEQQTIDLCRDIAASTSGVERLVVGVVNPELMDLAALPAPTHGATAIVEIWGSEDSGAAALSGFAAKVVRGAWLMREIVQKDFSADRCIGHSSPGIKTMFFVSRRTSLSLQGFFDHWEHVHGPLANRVHVGCTRYIQNQRVRELSATPWQMDGISELYFPTPHSLLNGFHVDAEGRREVARDVAAFVGITEGYAVTEHLLLDRSSGG